MNTNYTIFIYRNYWNLLNYFQTRITLIFNHELHKFSNTNYTNIYLQELLEFIEGYFYKLVFIISRVLYCASTLYVS